MYVAGLSDYQVRFSNATDFAFIPVGMEEARPLSEKLRLTRQCRFVLTGVIDGALEVGGQKVLYVTVHRLEVSLESGAPVATLELGNAGG